MKQPTSKEDKKKNRRETLNSLCSVSALLLCVVCCIALIHVELRIQEHHRLISHSVIVCDQKGNADSSESSAELRTMASYES